jgi:hypothetical protein
VKLKRVFLLFLIIGTVLSAVPVIAHHGSAISYDIDIKSLKTMKGTVKEWVWKNPHCYVVYEVKGSDGKTVEWTAETSSTYSMRGEFGWSPNTLKAGDEITVGVLPSKLGTPAGLLYKVVDSNGKLLIEDKSRLRADQR